MKYLKNGHAVEIVTELPDSSGFVVETYSEDSETGEAPEELRKPLLTGRRGKGTKKQRKQRNQKR